PDINWCITCSRGKQLSVWGESETLERSLLNIERKNKLLFAAAEIPSEHVARVTVARRHELAIGRNSHRRESAFQVRIQPASFPSRCHVPYTKSLIRACGHKR